MRKFGLFVPGGSVPATKYEGDYIALNGAYVTVFRLAKEGDADTTDKVCAIVHLAPGQSVKELDND